MVKKIFSTAVALFLVFSLATAAWADFLQADADTLAVGNQVLVDLGSSVAPGAPISEDVLLYIGGTSGVYKPAKLVTGAQTSGEGKLGAMPVWIYRAGKDFGVNSLVRGNAPISPGLFNINVTWSANLGSSGVSKVTVTFTGTVVVPKPIDTTKPVVKAAPDRDPDHGTWYNKDVLVTFSAEDEAGGSGIDYTTLSSPVTVGTDGENQVIGGSATDKAGNTGYGSISINLDKTKPTITGAPTTDPVAGSDGWYKDQVTVHFVASDAVSGIEEQPADQIINTFGPGQSVTATVYDKAGNFESATVDGLNIDTTAPTINAVNNAVYKLNQAANWTASDTGSGLASPGNGILDTSSVGTNTVIITASDKVGHVTTETITYKVEYVFGGFLQPIKMDGSGVYKTGRTIPVKFQLKDANGAYVSNAIANISCVLYVSDAAGTLNEAVSTSAATTGTLFRYEPTENQYIFNLSTKGLQEGQKYLIEIMLNDGTSPSVVVGLR